LAESHTSAHTALAHHFDNMEQQREAGTLGMWAFLITEIMFFGGLFMGYILYRSKFPVEFAAGSSHLDVRLGGINTAVLIISSLTMALAVYYSQTGDRRLLIIFLILTMILGAAFLGIKAVEYKSKFDDNLFPNKSFKWGGDEGHLEQAGGGQHTEGLTPAPESGYQEAHAGGADPQRVQMFYWIYFAMTGLHALHMIIGLGILAVLVYMAYRGSFSPEYHAPVEISGLYWHFVDIVWIFLFPLLYLIGRH
jgi:cytochrome c oxidase subunit 3